MTTSCLPVSPWRVALCLHAAMPCGVVGPVLSLALVRFAVICAER